MDNPEKLATLGTQDEDKQSKTHNAIGVRHQKTQTSTNNVNKTRNLQQITGDNTKTDRTSFLCGNVSYLENTTYMTTCPRILDVN